MKRTLYYGAAALGLLFTSCGSEDVILPEGNEQVTTNQTLFVNMRITGDVPDSGTRAAGDNGAPVDTDFQDGEAEENALNNVYFVFYDSKGDVVGDIVNIDIATMQEADELKGGSVEKAYKSTVPVSVKKGEQIPTQVICYINPISPSTLNTSLNSIQTVARASVTTTANGKRYFAMSNSVYYPDGETPNSKPTVAVPIDRAQLYTSESAAEEALGSGNTVDIYVERYATKLSFEAVSPTEFNSATRVYKADGNYDVVPVSLDFVPQYWAVNAESKRSYVIKSFRAESATGELLGQDYTYDQLNSIINVDDMSAAFGSGNVLNNNDMWDWNNPDFHRSYWGMSPAYFQSTYPEVSSDLKEIGEDNIQQKYISYKELVDKKYGFPATSTTPQYFKETTVGSLALNSDNPTAAVASVIYVGKYVLNINGSPLEDGTSFYTYLSGPVPGEDDDHPYVYFDNVSGQTTSKVEGGESMLKRFFAQVTILYKPVLNEDNEVVDYTRLSISNPEDLALLTRALEVSEISDEVKQAYDGNDATKLKLQNNTRSLQFKNVKAAEGIYIVTGNGYNQIVENPTGNHQVSLTAANIAIMRQVGYSYYYTSGHAYFNIPVKHFGWYRKGNANRTDGKDNPNINWNLVRVGDFGMVRNHSYQIKVQEIKGLGQGIGSDDNPIVPPSNSEDYFMAYSVRILKWAVVPDQTVKL